MRDLDRQLARVAEREAVVGAWVARHDDETLRAAQRALPTGPLAGWTVGVKDVIDTADLPTERGSVIYAGRTTSSDAACVALARHAGALVVGKTTTTEFALFTPARTTNPHNPAHTPGGSSSGSAAAVADHMVRAAFGTQTVGSVIRPAAFCGVVGFKPTHGLVPMSGVAALSPSFDTVGWLTRSVADAGAMFEAMTGSSPPVEAAPSRRWRIARYRSHQWDAAQPEMAEVLDEAAGHLAHADVDLVDLDPLPHLEEVADAAKAVMSYETARVFRWERDAHPDLIGPAVLAMLERADAVDHDLYAKSQNILAAARAAHDAFLAASDLDALLTPSAPGEAPTIETTGDAVFNRNWTSLGGPAIQLPTGTGPTGLPVGVQLAGRRWADAALLALAAGAEAALGPALVRS